MTLGNIASAAILVADAVTIGRALLRPHREPASRIAWIAAILALPVIGVLSYLLLGETRISGPRRERGKEVLARLPKPRADGGQVPRDATYRAPFALASSINELKTTTGNQARLVADSNEAIDRMIADIASARESAHGCFYIWLADHNGTRLAQAFIEAARRGVRVRLLADALGSRKFIRSRHWQDMKDAGCDVRVALPVGNPLWTVIRGRVDIRNHRKLMVVDDEIAWCGSQNCADPEFRIKKKFAPWVDVMSRWTGPVVAQCQYLFVSDWMAEGGDDISRLLTRRPKTGGGSIAALAFGTGPTAEFDAMPACFSELIHTVREELVVTTPYFIPDEQLLFALTSAARRGVKVVILFPHRNDNWIVAGASRSYYRDLIDAGAQVFEFLPGLLHAKTMVVDRRVGLIGSANLDRRSFELNFENNILFEDEAFALALREQQNRYLGQSEPVTRSDVDNYSLFRCLWQNLLATFSPML